MKQIHFEPGDVIDNRYKIISHLGEGGMGAVWKASDARTNDSIVVLKFPLKYNDFEILERFATEAGTMRALAGDCDNILDIQDIGSVAINDIDNVPYYVMRFQTGGQLRDWQLPKDQHGNAIYSPEAFKWVSGVATALDFLHHQPDPVFHRDVKPENILFNASGTPKLADFGIVKSIKKATTTITKTGAAMGTVAYMPPEIWRGGDFSPASDQFSFVSTVYEMILGHRPYNGETPFAMLESLSKGHQKLSEAIEFPAAASVALDRGLSHAPDERFESCGAFAEAFLVGLQQAPPIVQPLPPSELETGMHQSALLPGDSTGNGNAVIDGQPVVPVPPPTNHPQGVSLASNRSGPDDGLFAEDTHKPVQPKKPTTPTSGGFLWPTVIGVISLAVGADRWRPSIFRRVLWQSAAQSRFLAKRSPLAITPVRQTEAFWRLILQMIYQRTSQDRHLLSLLSVCLVAPVAKIGTKRAPFPCLRNWQMTVRWNHKNVWLQFMLTVNLVTSIPRRHLTGC